MFNVGDIIASSRTNESQYKVLRVDDTCYLLEVFKCPYTRKGHKYPNQRKADFASWVVIKKGRPGNHPLTPIFA